METKRVVKIMITVIFIVLSFILRVYVSINVIPIYEKGLSTGAAFILIIFHIAGLSLWTFSISFSNYIMVNLKLNYPKKYYEKLQFLLPLAMGWSILSSVDVMFYGCHPYTIAYLSTIERLFLLLDKTLFVIPVIFFIPAEIKVKREYEKFNIN